MFYEVIEITETAYGMYGLIRGRFDLLSEAEDFVIDTYGKNPEDIYIQDAWGEVVWG